MNYTLTRLPYFFLKIICEVGALYAIGYETNLSYLIALAIIIISIIFIAVPRANDCGWPKWIAWTTLIPLIGYISSIALLLAPTRTGLFDKS